MITLSTKKNLIVASCMVGKDQLELGRISPGVSPTTHSLFLRDMRETAKTLGVVFNDDIPTAKSNLEVGEPIPHTHTFAEAMIDTTALVVDALETMHSNVTEYGAKLAVDPTGRSELETKGSSKRPVAFRTTFSDPEKLTSKTVVVGEQERPLANATLLKKYRELFSKKHSVFMPIRVQTHSQKPKWVFYHNGLESINSKATIDFIPNRSKSTLEEWVPKIAATYKFNQDTDMMSFVWAYTRWLEKEVLAKQAIFNILTGQIEKIDLRLFTMAELISPASDVVRLSVKKVKDTLICRFRACGTDTQTRISKHNYEQQLTTLVNAIIQCLRFEERTNAFAKVREAVVRQLSKVKEG